MITALRNSIATLLFAFLFVIASYGQTPSSATSDCEEFVFSNVRHVPEADDYVGTEIVLNVCSGGADIRGAWHEYEGYHPVTTNLSGRRSRRTIRLRGKNSEGKVEFVGRLDGERLTGKLIWYIGNSRQEKSLKLPRKQCPVRPK